ncbi:MAG: methyltransferase domain-containing protein [Acidobacteria bacterium]|nr:MAG: methyltransferase domain-containing protein [Acidobacteriota bacterium]
MTCVDDDARFRERFLSGAELYGDELPAEAVAEWVIGEREAYSALVEEQESEYRYAYHGLNWWHGWRRLKGRQWRSVLGFGSALGEELAPIAEHVERITIIEPSGRFAREELFGKPCRYVTPRLDGRIEAPNEAFDLVTCLGVLHHIPNVSFVLSELVRVLAPGGVMLLREPIVSMGDWRRRRPGLSARERGIPPAILRRALRVEGVNVRYWGWCICSPLAKAARLAGIRLYATRWGALVDGVFSAALAWNWRYHPERIREKFAPSAVFVVVGKERGELASGPAT